MSQLPFRERAKGWLDLLQVALTIAAILTAGWWFHRQGQNRPHLKVEHRVTSRRLSPDRQLLVVDVRMSNVGSIPLSLGEVKIKVYEIRPEGRVLAYSEQRGKTLEPGEETHVYEEFDQIEGDVSVVRVYSFFENSVTRGRGWDLATIYDMGESGTETVGKEH